MAIGELISSTWLFGGATFVSFCTDILAISRCIQLSHLSLENKPETNKK